MPGAKDENFDGLTIAYNGVQFGGGDAPFKSQPPTYKLQQRAIYDEANRSVTHIRYTLNVFCTFYQSSEEDLSVNLEVIKFRLLKPGEPLEISGIALGFISKTSDQIWGPKPISFDVVNTHGVIAVDTLWVVEFNGPPCGITIGTKSLAFSAINTESTYSNDFEGQTTRTISGYYEIPQSRTKGQFGANIDSASGGSSTKLQKIADDLRDSVIVDIPFGFRRVQNVWRGNKAKNRIDFTVIDEALPGRPYPVGITRIENDQLEFATDPFTATTGTVTLTATMTVSPNFAPSLAGLHFFALAAHKQAEMVKKLNASVATPGGKATAFVLPTRLVIRSGIYDNARTTSFLTQWQTTGCLANILFHSPWSPVPSTNYNKWKTSMEPLWGNTGNRGLRDGKNNDAIINICNNPTKFKTGVDPSESENPISQDPSLLPCPTIPPESSWISYDVEVTFHRIENDSFLRRMVKPFASAAATALGIGAPVTTLTKMKLGKPFDGSSSGQDITVSNGRPQQFILIRAKGRRVNHNPVFPTLTTVGGVDVEPVTGAQYAIKTVAKFGGCSILEMKGFQWYKAEEYISDYGPKDNPVLCATTQQSSPKV